MDFNEYLKLRFVYGPLIGIAILLFGLLYIWIKYRSTSSGRRYVRKVKYLNQCRYLDRMAALIKLSPVESNDKDIDMLCSTMYGIFTCATSITYEPSAGCKYAVSITLRRPDSLETTTKTIIASTDAIDRYLGTESM